MPNLSITYADMLLDVHNELKTMLCDAVPLDTDPGFEIDSKYIQGIVNDIADLNFLWMFVQDGDTPDHRIDDPSPTLWSLLEEWGIDCER